MSSPYDREDDPQRSSEPIDDLMVPENEPQYNAERDRFSSSVRDIASRIPESQDKLEQLVIAGVFRSRAEAAAYLIDEGIRSQSALFERVEQKLGEIERLRAELRGIVGEKPSL